MTCEHCSNTKFEYISPFENKCTFCGFLQTTFETETIEFLDTKQYNRCQTYESTDNIVIRNYMLFLKNIWSNVHFENIQHEIRIKSQHISNYNTSILLGIVLKYASINSIPCNYIQHKKKLNVSSKELGKSLRQLNAGIISEGLCNDIVKNYIEIHGDSNIVRPNSMIGVGHTVTKNLANKIQKQTTPKPTGQYSIDQFKFIHNITNLINCNNNIDDTQFYEQIYKIYMYFKQTDMCKLEGNNIVIISIIYIVSKKKRLIKNIQQYCSKTRLTSAPTLSKILNKYSLEKQIIEQFKI